MDMRVSVIVVVVCGCLSACVAPEPEPDFSQPPPTLAEPDTSRVLFAALQYWRAKHPLLRRTRCYVFVEHPAHRAFPTFERQLGRSQFTVEYGSPGNHPPTPYYELSIGRMLPDQAFIVVSDGRDSAILELRLQGGRWTVVVERPDIII